MPTARVLVDLTIHPARTVATGPAFPTGGGVWPSGVVGTDRHTAETPCLPEADLL